MDTNCRNWLIVGSIVMFLIVCILIVLVVNIVYIQPEKLREEMKKKELDESLEDLRKRGAEASFELYLEAKREKRQKKNEEYLEK